MYINYSTFLLLLYIRLVLAEFSYDELKKMVQLPKTLVKNSRAKVASKSAKSNFPRKIDIPTTSTLPTSVTTDLYDFITDKALLDRVLKDMEQSKDSDSDVDTDDRQYDNNPEQESESVTVTVTVTIREEKKEEEVTSSVNPETITVDVSRADLNVTDSETIVDSLTKKSRALATIQLIDTSEENLLVGTTLLCSALLILMVILVLYTYIKERKSSEPDGDDNQSGPRGPRRRRSGSGRVSTSARECSCLLCRPDLYPNGQSNNRQLSLA